MVLYVKGLAESGTREELLRYIKDGIFKGETASDCEMSVLALTASAGRGLYDVVKLLLEPGMCGARVDSLDEYGKSALMSASKTGETKIAQLLIDEGAKVDLRGPKGRTALMFTYSSDRHESWILGVAKLLIERGAQVNLSDDDSNTALLNAGLGGQSKMTALLLERGAKIEMRNNHGYSALSNASEKGHYETAKLLLENGAKVDGGSVFTPLMVACRNGCLEVVTLLLDRGAMVDLQDGNGLTPLMYATGKKGNLEIAKVLLEKGAKISLQNNTGKSALMFASKEGDYEVASLLVENGAEVDLLDDSGWSPLMSASRSGGCEVAKLLLDCGAEIDRRDQSGYSALVIASKWCVTTAAKLLVEEGAEVNMQDKDGWTALMHAIGQVHTRLAKEANLELARLLLEHGADADLQSSKWESARSLARKDATAMALIEEMVSYPYVCINSLMPRLCFYSAPTLNPLLKKCLHVLLTQRRLVLWTNLLDRSFLVHRLHIKV